MPYFNFLFAGLLVTGICLQAFLTVEAAPSETASKPEIEQKNSADGPTNTRDRDVTDENQTPPASDASSGESLIPKPPSPSVLVKRDVEQEADSANGKTPFYLWKKNFYHPNTRRFLSSASNANDYSAFPPYTGAYSGTRYQRHRRSFQTDSFNAPLQFQPIATHSRHPTDELEVQLDNPQDKEAFLRLMALLMDPKESSQLLNYNNLLNEPNSEDNDGVFEDDPNLSLPIDLGYYGSAPGDTYHQYSPSYELDGSENGTPGDLARLGMYLSKVPGAHHGLYVSPLKQRQDIEDDWLDDAVPLQSHFKRSDSSLFRHNPVKSHFRRYLRSGNGPSGYNEDAAGFISGGRFGPFYPQGDTVLIRKRRSYNSAKVTPFTM